MRTAVAGTSLEAFRSLQSERKLQPMQQKILDAVADGRAYTRKQLRDITGMELSSVCGRVNSMMESGLLEARGEVRDPSTGKPQELVGLPPG